MHRAFLCLVAALFLLPLSARADLAQDLAEFSDLWAAAPKNARASSKPLVKVAREIVARYNPADYPGQLRPLAQAYWVVAQANAKAKKHKENLELVSRILCCNVPGEWYVEGLVATGLWAAHICRETEKGLELIERGNELLGPRFAYGPRTVMYKRVVDIYLDAGRADDALAFVEECLRTRPWYFSSAKFWQEAYRVFRRAQRVDEARQAAKLAFMLCAYNEEEIAQAVDLVVQAFTAQMDVAAANQFLDYQQNSAKPNPLAAIPLPQLTANERRLAFQAAESHRQARADSLISLHLMLGEYDEALGMARQMLGAAKTQAELSAALAEIARCFKAKDMNLIRANQFLRYARIGKGANPLDNF